MKRYFIPAAILIILGSLFSLYPIVSSYLAERQQEQVIVGYENAVTAADKKRIKEEWEKAFLYNKNRSNYMDVLNLNGDGVMGYLEIPKIEISIPIYHCSTEETLNKGAGHVEQTGLPIGEKGNHCMITGHRGVPNAQMFTRLDELKKGDRFYLYILDETFAYEVSKIAVIIPEEINEIEEYKEKDLVTLVTCTPYGVNSHRLLVTGERVDLEKTSNQEQEVDTINRNKIIFYAIIIFTGMAIFLYPHFVNQVYEVQTEKQKMLFISNRSKMAFVNEALYQELKKSNEALYKTGQAEFSSLDSCEKPNINLKVYGMKDNIIGYIHIPKMKIELPILLGASENNMKLGAVHLTGTSYPIGGIHTNSVIAAHRGYSKAAMFREIEKLETGDKVYIRNFKEKLCYKVTEIRVILPEDIDQILIQEGKDMVTLITCHPYRKNFQRYVVFCERI